MRLISLEGLLIKEKKKLYPRPSLPCGHTHIWERLGEGNTNIKSQMGGLCSTSSDGKQPMKKVQLSNHLFLRFIEVCIWLTTQPRKTYCSSTTNQNQYTLGQIGPSSRGRMMLSVQRKPKGSCRVDFLSDTKESWYLEHQKNVWRRRKWWRRYNICLF